jgi:lipoprotein-releasing system permease protein
MHFLFAWRYFKAPKSTHAINWIAWTSMVAIVIGTAALILVLSVFNGFEGMVKSLYSSFYPDWKLSPQQGKFMRITPQQWQSLQKIEGIKAVSGVIEERALLQNGENQTMVQLKGVDANYPLVSGVPAHLTGGDFETGTADFPMLVMGVGVEDALGIFADRHLYPLTVYLPRSVVQQQLDWTSDIRVDSIKAAASFVIQQDFDNQYGITSIDFMRRAMALDPAQVTGVEISTDPKADAKKIRTAMQALLGKEVKVQDRYEQNRSLYAVMRTERWIVYGVLTLILVVAAFTMIGALTMLVLEKQKDISILHALGADCGFIRGVFLSEGVLLASLGGFIGMLIALTLALLQIKFHLIPLKGGSFLIDYYPVALRGEDFVLVGATVLFIAVLASWLPAEKASRRQLSLRAE